MWEDYHIVSHNSEIKISIYETVLEVMVLPVYSYVFLYSCVKQNSYSVLCWGGNSWWNYRLITCIWSYICSRPLQWPLHCLSPALGILFQGYPWIQFCWPTLHTPLLLPSAQLSLRLFFSKLLNLIKSCPTSLVKNKRPPKGLKTSC